MGDAAPPEISSVCFVLGSPCARVTVVSTAGSFAGGRDEFIHEARLDLHFTVKFSGTGLMPRRRSARRRRSSRSVSMTTRPDFETKRLSLRPSPSGPVFEPVSVKVKQLVVRGILALDLERPVLDQQRLLRADGRDDRPFHRPLALRLRQRAGEAVKLRKLRRLAAVDAHGGGCGAPGLQITSTRLPSKSSRSLPSSQRTSLPTS